MQLKQLFADEDAVSPVIGVILMVAITVILAAVIGTFVLGLGDQVDNSAPQANFQFSYDEGSTSGYAESGEESFKVTHNGGDSVERKNLAVNVGGTQAYASGSAQTDYTIANSNNWKTTVGTGQILELKESGADSISSNDEIRIIWSNPSGGSSNTIGQSTVPS